MTSSLILVTGGTGTLGRHVVARLRQAGCDVRVLSRRPHAAAGGIEYVKGDLLEDEGLQAAARPHVGGLGPTRNAAAGGLPRCAFGSGMDYREP